MKTEILRKWGRGDLANWQFCRTEGIHLPATPEPVLAAAKVELARALPESHRLPEPALSRDWKLPRRSGAAIQRLEFLLHGIVAGLISPKDAKTEIAKSDCSQNQ